MLKYVYDYINGNEIDVDVIEKLENDKSFMLAVFKITKDSNFYNLCSDDLKLNYEFVSELINLFRDNYEFITKVADHYVEYYRAIANIGPFISEDDDRNLIELLITMSEISLDKYDSHCMLYKLLLATIVSTRMVEVEKVKIETEKYVEFAPELECGFVSIYDSYSSSTKVTDYFAREYLNNIFSNDYLNLEEYVHGIFKDKDSLNKYGVNNVLLDAIKCYDEALSSYTATHLYLLNDYKKDMNHILYRWNSYDDIKNVKMCKKICSAIQDYLEYNYPESELDSTSWMYYVAEKLGITKMFLKYDGFGEEYVEDMIDSIDKLYFSEVKLADLRHLSNMKKMVSDILAGKDVDPFSEEYQSKYEQERPSNGIILDFKKNE